MKGRLIRRALDAMGVLFLIVAVCAAAASMEEALPTLATDGKDLPRIVIDAGHGGRDGGAEGAKSGVQEAPLNLAVAKKLEQALLDQGFDVTMTRSGADALAEGKRADMEARREILRGSGVSAVISIHMNHFSDPAVAGPMAFYMRGSTEGEALATSIIEQVCTALGREKRPANPGDYYVLRESIAPAVIVECGFLSNPEDEALLQQEAHQQALAEGIAEGVARHFAGT